MPDLPLISSRLLAAALLGAVLPALAQTTAPATAGATARDAPKLDDTSISDMVDRELTQDRAVPGYRIDVSTQDGIVTLTGSVSNLRAKDRSARIAETVKGVRAVVNRITVEPVARSDAEIRTAVENALLLDPAADAYDIATSVTDGAVTLTGNVESWYEKELAVDVAKGVSGVESVTDRIDLRYATERSDDEILAEVKSKLRWDRYIDDAMIDVAVADGVVTLSGTVGSAAEKRRARAKAWTTGVTNIDDAALAVGYWSRDDRLRADKYVVKSDDQIRSAVQSALGADPRTDGSELDVSVQKGVVTLRGKVESLAARRAAAQSARNTVGVIKVNNLMKVRNAEPASDTELANDVRAALKRDSYVDRYDVTTSVRDGVAYLSGSVDSYFEKAQAESVASSVPGVMAVRNNLAVDYAGAPLAYDPYVYDWYPYDFEWWTYDMDGPTTVKRNDAAIADDIEDQLFWSPFVDANDVSVEVDDGVATLQGSVDTQAERSAAVENALEGGAIRVIDRLTVSR